MRTPYDGEFNPRLTIGAGIILAAMEFASFWVRQKRRQRDYQAGFEAGEVSGMLKAVARKARANLHDPSTSSHLYNTADLIVVQGRVMKNRYGDNQTWMVTGKVATLHHDEKSQEPVG